MVRRHHTYDIIMKCVKKNVTQNSFHLKTNSVVDLISIRYWGIKYNMVLKNVLEIFMGEIVFCGC